jgi:outer membrane receptor protein involved in Fe transport
VISVAGQKGIQNNISVDGADFNNPFFGEQRGGQRPAFVFNLDAVQDFVVVSQGANAEFGRSSGGFVNIITKSGTNALRGTAHYFGQGSALSADFARGGGNPNYNQGQAGFTLGGPLKRDRAFFFVAYDQQRFRQTKQTADNRFASAPLRAFLDSAYGGVLAGDYRSIRRTNDAQVALAKVDVRLSEAHQASLKYNYTNARQENGTFDVDVWGRSANGLERSYSNALNGALNSTFAGGRSNEFRFQVAREDRPRPYDGPVNPTTGRRFPDTGVSFDGYRFGQPFFLPVEAYDTRLQLLDNVSLARGTHFFKAGGEWNRTSVRQTFQGFANGRAIFSSVDGFLNYNRFGPGYVECSNGATSSTGACPAGPRSPAPCCSTCSRRGSTGVPRPRRARRRSCSTTSPCSPRTAGSRTRGSPSTTACAGRRRSSPSRSRRPTRCSSASWSGGRSPTARAPTRSPPTAGSRATGACSSRGWGSRST